MLILGAAVPLSQEDEHLEVLPLRGRHALTPRQPDQWGRGVFWACQITVVRKPTARSPGGRMVSTGQGARRTTRPATLPSGVSANLLDGFEQVNLHNGSRREGIRRRGSADHLVGLEEERRGGS